VHRRTLLAVAAIVAIGTSAGVAAASAPTAPAKVKVRTTKLGTVLVDGKGVTLYLFTKDTGGKSVCFGPCAKAWPPLLTKGAPQALGSAKASELGTVRRGKGYRQVTYNGHPLYYFTPDGGVPGKVTGQDVGGIWFVVNTSGNAIKG
jgi:predicted lipoprotein with Yx(FWY)xxD motif